MDLMMTPKSKRWIAAGISLVALTGGASNSEARQQSAVEAVEHAGNPEQDRRERYDGYRVVRVSIQSERQRRVMTSLELEPYNCRAPLFGATDYMVSPEKFPLLKEAGIEYVVMIENLQKLIDAEWARIQAHHQQRGVDWFAEYKDYAQMRAYTQSLVALRPDLASNFVVGQSLQARDIFGIRVTSAVGGPNKPGIFIHGLQHSREWVTGMSVTYIADRLVRTYETDAEIRSLLDTYEFYIVPCMNPDGYVHTWTTNRMWRKNRRDNGDGTFGVDLNRNWGFQWGVLPAGGSSGATNNETYRGPSAFSEPETTVMSNFVSSNPNMLMHIDVHSFSQLVLSAWGYTAESPADAGLFDTLNAGVVSSIFGVHGSTYVGGPTFTTIYPANGTASDWAYGARNMIGWGVECRDTGQTGFLLPADQILPNAEEVWAGFKWAGAWLRDNGLFISIPGGAPSSVSPDLALPMTIEFGRARQFPQAGSLRLFTRVGSSGGFTESVPSAVIGNLFLGTLPPAPCGSSVQFYVQGQTTSGVTVTFPPGGAGSPLVANVSAVATVFADDAEANLGWTLGAPGDTATSGQWVRANPIGTVSGVPVQPEDDHTVGAGVNCFFTGQGTAGGGAGQADVDSGFTTLVTPVLDVGGLENPRIGYWRWYSNARGGAPETDTFRVDISGNNGATWVNLETVGPAGEGTDGGWFYREFAVSEYITPTSAVRVRFIADDAGTGSLIEAAVDDVVVTADAVCPVMCPADFDENGIVNSQDFFDFVAAFFAGDADFNNDGSTNSQDFFDFITAFFTPC